MAVDLSALDAAGAYSLIFDHTARPDQRWIVVGLAEPAPGKAGQARAFIRAIGGGSPQQMMAAMPQDEISYGVYRVLGIDNKDSVPSTRVKVVLVTFSGPHVPRVRRAQATPVKDKIRGYFKGHSADLEAHEADEVTPQEIERKLRSCGGAFLPDEYVFGSAGDESVHTFTPGQDIPAELAGPQAPINSSGGAAGGKVQVKKPDASALTPAPNAAEAAKATIAAANSGTPHKTPATAGAATGAAGGATTPAKAATPVPVTAGATTKAATPVPAAASNTPAGKTPVPSGTPAGGSPHHGVSASGGDKARGTPAEGKGTATPATTPATAVKPAGKATATGPASATAHGRKSSCADAKTTGADCECEDGCACPEEDKAACEAHKGEAAAAVAPAEDEVSKPKTPVKPAVATAGGSASGRPGLSGTVSGTPATGGLPTAPSHERVPTPAPWVGITSDVTPPETGAAPATKGATTPATAGVALTGAHGRSASAQGQGEGIAPAEAPAPVPSAGAKGVAGMGTEDHDAPAPVSVAKPTTSTPGGSPRDTTSGTAGMGSGPTKPAAPKTVTIAPGAKAADGPCATTPGTGPAEGDAEVHKMGLSSATGGPASTAVGASHGRKDSAASMTSAQGGNEDEEGGVAKAVVSAGPGLTTTGLGGGHPGRRLSAGHTPYHKAVPGPQDEQE